MSDSSETSFRQSDKTVLVLSLLLISLIALLIFLYKKLNREADGKYTIRRMVFEEGGIRDQARRATLALETRLGVQLWPRSDNSEDGEEMQEVHDEEGRVEEGGSQESDSEGDDQEEEEGSLKQSDKEKSQSDTSGANSSLDEEESEEKVRLVNLAEAKEETEEEAGGNKVGDGGDEGEPSGGTGLLINLKQFSGSVTWSEGGGSEGKEGDVTAL